MKTVEQSIHISKPVRQVFSMLADPKEQMKFDGDMMLSCEKISEGAIGKGTRFRGNFKGMGNVEYEYADYLQDSLVEHSVTMPFGPMRHRFEFKPDANGTILKQSILLEPNFLGKILWGLMMKNKMTARINTLNLRVKKFAEG